MTTRLAAPPLALAVAAPLLAARQTTRGDPVARDPAQASPPDARHRFETRTAAAADAMIATGIEQRLQGDPSVGSMQIGVEARDGVVTLRGTVPRAEQRDRVAAVARDVPGVRRVGSQVPLERPGEPAPGASVVPAPPAPLVPHD